MSEAPEFSWTLQAAALALRRVSSFGRRFALSSLRLMAILGYTAAGMACDRSPPERPMPVRGVNLVQGDGAAFDSNESARSLMELRRLGANTVAIVTFLWQPNPQDPHPSFGSAVTDAQLIGGIRAAHAQGLTVVLKPHVWVPGRWAGDISMSSPEQWELWFDNYRKVILHYAQLAAVEKVAVFSLGTELEQASRHPRWSEMISAVRRVYPGRLTYVAHGMGELARLPFRDKLDILSLSLYVDLTGADSAAEQRTRMRQTLQEIREKFAADNKPVWIAELGIRALADAHRKPWESPEQRDGPADAIAQAQLLALWMDEIQAARFDGLLIWYWNSDPNVGGPHDSDFTVQNKVASGVLLCHWSGQCR